MTAKSEQTFKRIDEMLNRFERGDGHSRVVTRNVDGKHHYSIGIVRSDGERPRDPEPAQRRAAG